jgi:ribosomal protein S18 acetylase RimI-like enzyme
MLGMGLRGPYRGKGLGRQLIEQALQAARQHGFERIELMVRSPNARAIRLYSQVGFQEEGRKRDAVRLDDGSEDELMMALHFKENG